MHHSVRQGECLSTIAAAYGLPWKLIWDAPENKALRNRRRDPNVLYPGDQVFVPKPTPKSVTGATSAKHVFKVEGELPVLRLRLTASLQPLADEPYAIEFDGQTLEGRTDGEGKLEHPLPTRVSSVTLRLPERRQRYALSLGHIDPADTVSGAQARLRNLHLYEGPAHGQLDADTAAALRDFQRIEGLDETGEVDEDTAMKLRQVHGC